MDRARKSLSLLRQAASGRLPPASPSQILSPSSPGLVRSPSIGSPSAGAIEQESANPLFDLRRAAAPSGASADAELRRAATPSFNSDTSDLRRAASPSFNSDAASSKNGRVATDGGASSPVPANPILKREMAGMSGSNPAGNYAKATPLLSPASTQLSSLDPEDPGMNKMNLSSSRTGSMVNLMKQPQNIVLVPARFIKETTWGTPRRRICTSICLIIFAIIFIYLVVRLVDVLKILDSSPSVAEFKIADMCSSSIAMSVAGRVMNPSGSAATLKAMRVEVWIGNASIPNGVQLVGYIDTPDIFVGAGNASIDVPFTATLPPSQGPFIRKVIKDYIDGKDMDAIAKVPITASFAADVFIVPVSYSTNIEFKFKLPKLNSTSNSTKDDDEPDLIQMVELLNPNQPASYLAAKVALQLFTMKDFADSFIEATVPPMQFDIYFGDSLALSGATSFFHYGKNPPSGIELGQIAVTAATGLPYRQGVQFGLGKFMNKTKLPVRAVIRGPNFTNPEVSTYRVSGNRACGLQTILDTFDYSFELDLASLLNSTSTPSPSPSPAHDPYFAIDRYDLDDIETGGILKNMFNLDLAGMNQLYGLRGRIPPVQIYIETDGPNATVPRETVLIIDTVNAYTFYPNASIVTGAQLNLQVMSATQSIRVLNQYFLNGNDVNIYIRTPSSGSLLSDLLSSASLTLSLDDLMGSLTSSSSSRRRMDEVAQSVRYDPLPALTEDRKLSAWSNKSIGVNVVSDYNTLGAEIVAAGFDTDFFGGTNINLKRLEMRVKIPTTFQGNYDPLLGNNPYWSNYNILWLMITPYNSSASNTTVKFSFSMGDSGSGNILYGLVNNITQGGVNQRMLGQYRYNLPPFTPPAPTKNPTAAPTWWKGDDFYLQRTADVGTNATSSATPSFSAFKLYHAELLSLTSNLFSTHVYFGFDLGDLVLDIRVPQIALAIGRCKEDYSVSVSMAPWGFRTGVEVATAPVDFELEDASRVLNLLTTYVGGSSQRLCIVGHPSLAENFLSYFIGAVNLNFMLSGRSNETAPVGQEADLLDLVVTSNATTACVGLNLNLTDSNSTDNSSTSLGWGALNMVLATNDSNHADFLSIRVAEGWYGRVDPYRIEEFDAPNVVTPVQVTACILADLDLSLPIAQGATRGVLQKLYDGINIPVSVGGTLGQRLPPGNPNISTLSGNFNTPANTLESLQTLSVASPTSSINTTNWFELIQLEIISFNGTQFSTQITFETGEIGFNITVPTLAFHVGKLTIPGNKASEIKLFDISTYVPPFGFEEKYPLPVSLSIALISPQDWGDTLQLIDDFLTGVADVAIGSSTDPDSNLISQVIPTITFSLSKKDVVAPPTPGPDSLDISLTALSSTTSASILASATVLTRLDYKFIWGAINCRIFDGAPGSSNEIGRVFVPGQVLQEVGSGPQNINVTIYGAATALATRLFNGTQPLVVGFQGTIGASVFTSSFKIPASVTESLTLGNPDSSTSASSTFKILDAAILGASSPGASGTMPCIIQSICTNTILGDGEFAYSGITAGVTLQYDLPKVNRIRWRLNLNSSVTVSVVSNGFQMAKVVLYPISVQANQQQFSPVATLLFNLDQLSDVRYTIFSVMEGYDTVFSFSGDTTSNYLSNILSAISQDVAILDVAPPDPNAPSMLQELKLSLQRTVKNRAELGVSFNLLWTSSIVVSVGQVNVAVVFGHTKTCGPSNNKWCTNGINVATASTPSPLRINPNPVAQPLLLNAALFSSGGIQSPSQIAADDLISRYIWALEIPLEANVTFTPFAGNPYGVTNPFTIRLFATIPQSVATSSFIDAINIDIGGTITSSIGDVTVQAKKVLRNTLDFPLLISYYQYNIKLIDTDGVYSGGCSLFGGSGLVTKINPCTIPLLDLCYSPWLTPTAIDEGNLIKSGDYSQLKPGTSILNNGQKTIPAKGTGETNLVINPTVESASRLVDEMMVKDMMCGDIVDGLLVAGLQANANCDDAGRLEANLQCTYPIRVRFNLANYALGKVESCGSLMEVPSYLGTTFYTDDWYQFNTPWGSPSGVLNTPTTLLDSSVTSGARSDNYLMDTTDSFQISVDVRITDTGGAFCGDPSEAFSMTFLSAFPANAQNPRVKSCSSGTGCSNKYASSNLDINNLYGSLVMAFRGCNSIAWIQSGQISTPYRASQSCAGNLIDNGNWGTLTFTYNAHDKRGTASYTQGATNRFFDFDLNLAQALGTPYTLLSFIANSDNTCTKVEYQNVIHKRPRTNGGRTTIEGGFPLVRVNETGSVLFRARDENGRKRGSGGNTWTYEIREAVTNVLLTSSSHNTTLSPRVVDNADGTYTFRYQIYQRGRYLINIACLPGSFPYICNNANSFVTITNGLFIRV